jgi:hypothetical protein
MRTFLNSKIMIKPPFQIRLTSQFQVFSSLEKVKA